MLRQGNKRGRFGFERRDNSYDCTAGVQLLEMTFIQLFKVLSKQAKVSMAFPGKQGLDHIKSYGNRPRTENNKS